ncbi:MAG: ATP synthase F1 subunit epsilon [Rhodospirillales bacterium]|nr:ATP synthase F1 subunit epsilon [Alphaproteobacteria bacterium]MCB9981123.1 ATP synthase F1 subunit epsilon [Rhodospirillales bacterium]
MSDTIQFELVSPEEKLVSAPVHMAVIPGEEGEFGVLAGHSSLVASLQPGVVALYDEPQGEPRKIFIAGGFADVSAAQCTVLAEEAVLVSDLDQAKIEQKIADLNEDLGIAEEAADKARIEKRLNLFKAKLSAVTGHLVT